MVPAQQSLESFPPSTRENPKIILGPSPSDFLTSVQLWDLRSAVACLSFFLGFYGFLYHGVNAYSSCIRFGELDYRHMEYKMEWNGM